MEWTKPTKCNAGGGAQGGEELRQEHAARSAQVAWDMHTHAPVLGEIDRAIAAAAAGEEGSSHAFGEIRSSFRVA